MDTENPVRIENAGFRSVREIIIVSTMSPFFIATRPNSLEIFIIRHDQSSRAAASVAQLMAVEL